jgi:hypothetical protein
MEGKNAVNWTILLLALVALGIGSLVAGGTLVASAMSAHTRRPGCANPAETFLHSGDGRADAFTKEDLYALRGVPWTLWGTVGTLTGVLLAYLLLARYNAVFALVGLVGASVPRLVRAYLVRRRRTQTNRHVGEFVSLLGRALCLGGGLGPALQDIVGLLEPGVLRERLQHHLERAVTPDPTDVIKRLALDIRSAQLDTLIVGIEAARKAREGCSETVTRYPWLTTGCTSGRPLVVELLPAQPGLPARYPYLVLRDPDRRGPLAHRLALPLIRAETLPHQVRSLGAALDPRIAFPVTGEAPGSPWVL